MSDNQCMGCDRAIADDDAGAIEILISRAATNKGGTGLDWYSLCGDCAGRPVTVTIENKKFSRVVLQPRPGLQRTVTRTARRNQVRETKITKGK